MLIQADFDVLQDRMTRMMQATMMGEGDPATTEAQVAAELPFNCEQSSPSPGSVRTSRCAGDLHHLFACESRCNSFRSNTPYTEFTEFTDFPTPPPPSDIGVLDAIREDCGKSADVGFEPAHGKGAAARAVFYFRLRYADLITDERMPGDRWATLTTWHEHDPVSTWERHRNAAIFDRQGNRNPFIDHPDWLPDIAATLPR